MLCMHWWLEGPLCVVPKSWNLNWREYFVLESHLYRETINNFVNCRNWMKYNIQLIKQQLLLPLDVVGVLGHVVLLEFPDQSAALLGVVAPPSVRVREPHRVDGPICVYHFVVGMDGSTGGLPALSAHHTRQRSWRMWLLFPRRPYRMGVPLWWPAVLEVFPGHDVN